MPSRDFFAYPPTARPRISVDVGGAWLPGELRSWIRRNDQWWAHVDYTAPTRRTVTATVPAHRIAWTDPAAAPPPDEAPAPGMCLRGAARPRSVSPVRSLHVLGGRA